VACGPVVDGFAGEAADDCACGCTCAKAGESGKSRTEVENNNERSIIESPLTARRE
jgi:hypothetical protein